MQSLFSALAASTKKPESVKYLFDNVRNHTIAVAMAVIGVWGYTRPISDQALNALSIAGSLMAVAIGISLFLVNLLDGVSRIRRLSVSAAGKAISLVAYAATSVGIFTMLLLQAALREVPP